MARDPDHAPFSKYFSPAGWNLIAYVEGRQDILPVDLRTFLVTGQLQAASVPIA